MPRHTQALMAQHVAASVPMSGRRSVPTVLQPLVHRRRHQRWRERPRCRDPKVALALSEAGSFTPSMVLSDVAAHDARLSAGIAPPACLVPSVDHPDEHARKLGGKWASIGNESCGKMRPRSVFTTSPSSIAPVSLMPCSPSSMLFAPLRPGPRPGLRALTTPPRGMVLALARCWQFLDVKAHRLRDATHEATHEVDASVTEAYSATIVRAVTALPPLAPCAAEHAFESSLLEHDSDATTGSHVVIALAGSVWNRCTPRTASMRALRGLVSRTWPSEERRGTEALAASMSRQHAW